MNKVNKILKEEFVNGKTWFDWAFLLVGLLMQAVGVAAGFISGNPDSIGPVSYTHLTLPTILLV